MVSFGSYRDVMKLLYVQHCEAASDGNLGEGNDSPQLLVLFKANHNDWGINSTREEPIHHQPTASAQMQYHRSESGWRESFAIKRDRS